jgi:hypothetical protein
MLSPRRPILAAALLLAGASCARAPAPPVLGQEWPALCKLETRSRVAAVEPVLWQAFLLGGFDPRRRALEPGARDCAGFKLDPGRGVGRCAPDAAAPDWALRPLDVATGPAGPGAAFVWTPSHVRPSGMAHGPIALAHERGGRVTVHALGRLALFPGDVRIGVERLAGEPVLLADGEHCPGSARASCRRMTRLLAVRRGRIEPLAVVARDGTCLGEAAVYERRERPGREPSGGRTRVAMTTTLTLAPERATLQERLVVTEAERPEGTSAPRVLRTAERERHWTLSGGALIADGPSLWQDEEER